LPAAIGALKATGKDVVCLAGDGSIMMNLQELQTIAGNHLPVKIFILNNEGYVSIFQTQRNFFQGDEVGAGPASGVSLPSFERLSAAFGLPYRRAATLAEPGPAVCELILDKQQAFAPKLSSRQLPDGRMVSPALEDLSPFLPRDVLRDNMIIPLEEE
jgi:acetolactate synthase-1/2/3 large subunit